MLILSSRLDGKYPRRPGIIASPQLVFGCCSGKPNLELTPMQERIDV